MPMLILVVIMILLSLMNIVVDDADNLLGDYGESADADIR